MHTTLKSLDQSAIHMVEQYHTLLHSMLHIVPLILSSCSPQKGQTVGTPAPDCPLHTPAILVQQQENNTVAPPAVIHGLFKVLNQDINSTLRRLEKTTEFLSTIHHFITFLKKGLHSEIDIIKCPCLKEDLIKEKNRLVNQLEEFQCIGKYKKCEAFHKVSDRLVYLTHLEMEVLWPSKDSISSSAGYHTVLKELLSEDLGSYYDRLFTSLDTEFKTCYSNLHAFLGTVCIVGNLSRRLHDIGYSIKSPLYPDIGPVDLTLYQQLNNMPTFNLLKRCDSCQQAMAMLKFYKIHLDSLFMQYYAAIMHLETEIEKQKNFLCFFSDIRRLIRHNYTVCLEHIRPRLCLLKNCLCQPFQSWENVLGHLPIQRKQSGTTPSSGSSQIHNFSSDLPSLIGSESKTAPNRLSPFLLGKEPKKNRFHPYPLAQNITYCKTLI